VGFLDAVDTLARGSATALDGIAATGAGAVRDLASVSRGRNRGDDLDEWDPEYIRRTLPLNRAVLGTYFRAEVRGMDNIPASGPSSLWATTPAGS
jgi:hypothetical protein